MSQLLPLSVITATHNDGNYIQEAVASILNQAYGDFEYIIVDDASTDQTTEILRSIKDERVTILRNERKAGPGAARNRALEVSRGEYVAIMDGDDISHPERFHIQLDYLNAHPDISYLGTGVKVVDKETGSFIRNELKPLTDGAIRWMLLYKSPIIHSTNIGRRDMIIQSGCYDERLLRSQDVDLMRKIARIGKLANLPDILYTYKVRSGSTLDKMNDFAKPFVQQVHSTYMNDLLKTDFDLALGKFVWSMRYPIPDDFPDVDHDDVVFRGIGMLFNLYAEFRQRYDLSNDELRFIQKDMLHWISRMASKSENYSDLLETLLRGENLSNLEPGSYLLKAWVKSLLGWQERAN